MHCDVSVRAANAGVHVLCEKPMAVTSAECERMIAAAQANDVQLMVAYRLHFERANLEAAALARSGKIGPVRYFDSQFSMQVKAGNIRLDRELGGGALYDIGIYCINAARSVMAAEPLEVWAAATRVGDRRFREVHDTISAMMKFPDQRLASFVCSFGAADRSAYQVVGTKGSLHVEPAYEYAQGLAYELTVGEHTRRRRFGKSDQFAAELLYFSKCVLEGREVEPSGEEGLADVRVIEALQRSITTGRSVTLDIPQRRRRPTLRQEIRRPPVQKPQLVKVTAASN
jgi:glucose-fructose oxidoreductase